MTQSTRLVKFQFVGPFDDTSMFFEIPEDAGFVKAMENYEKLISAKYSPDFTSRPNASPSANLMRSSFLLFI